MTTQQFWNKWALYFVAYAVMLPITVYQLFHNWGEWLFLTARGLAWFLITYRLLRDIKSLERDVDEELRRTAS
jgi:hypothetical protein